MSRHRPTFVPGFDIEGPYRRPARRSRWAIVAALLLALVIVTSQI